MTDHFKGKKDKKFLLLTSAAAVLMMVSAPYAKAQDADAAGAPPENIMEAAPEAMSAPSPEALDEIDQQLQDLEEVLEAANANVDENGLPVIDPDNEPDVFYDSMPVRRGVQPTAPEKVDPIAKPAGKIVHVSKGFEKDSDQALLVSAKRALSLGRYDSALEFYNQLHKKNARDPRVLMGQAIALQNLGRVQSAIQAYEKLLDVQPKNLQARVSMLGLVKSRFPALALKQMLELYGDNPSDAGLNAQIGMSYAEIGNMNDALRYLGMAVSLEPNNASYYYNLAVVSDRAGKVKSAIRFYEESLSKDTIYGGGRSIPRDAIYERLSVIRQRS